MTKAISIYDVIKTIIREKNWFWAYLNGEALGEELITFNEFRMILTFNEITTYDRKIKELWELMIALKLARRSNKSSMIVNFDEVHKVMAKYNKITESDLKWAIQQSIESHASNKKDDEEVMI